MKRKNIIIALLIILLIAVASISVYFFSGKTLFGPASEKEGPRVVQKDFKIPNTTFISEAEGRIPSNEEPWIHLVPKDESEQIIAPNAFFTMKGAYGSARSNAVNWAQDARLVLIKSIGTLTLEGRAGQWQVVFGSATKKMAYEVIIHKDEVAAKKEVPAEVFGYPLPENWYDLNDAIQTLQSFPNFQDAMISSVSFFYSTDANMWRYSFNTSKGTVSLPVP